MSRVWGWVLTVTGLVACPCHFPFTLPLILGLLGGTGIGSFVGANTSLVYGIATGYFIVGIGVGAYLLMRIRSRHHHKAFLGSGQETVNVER